MSRQSIAWLLTLCMVLTLAACGGGGEAPAATTEAPAATAEAPAATTDESADAVVESTLQAFQGLQNLQASVDIAFSAPESGELSMDVIMEGSLAGGLLGVGDMPSLRAEVTGSTLDVLPEGTVAVFAPTSYFYNPTENVVLTADREAGTGGSQLYRLPLMFISSMTQVLQNLTSPANDCTVAGEEAIGDFTTTHVTCVPAADAGDNAPLKAGETLETWIDKETSLPVQVLFETETSKQTLTITSLEVNGEIDEAAFDYEPPDDAEVVDVTDPETVDSLEEASSSAGFTVPVPGYLPDGLPTEPTSIEVQETPLGSIVVQAYTTEVEAETGTGSAGITIDTLMLAGDEPERLPVSAPPGAAASAVEINGQDGILMSVNEGQASLSWQQDGMIITVRGGGGYGQDEVIKVAEALEIE